MDSPITKEEESKVKLEQVVEASSHKKRRKKLMEEKITRDCNNRDFLKDLASSYDINKLK